MKTTLNIVLLLIISISFTECGKMDDKIIAQVNGEKLYDSEFRSLFTEDEWLATSQKEKNEIIKDWIEITLLAKQAEKQGLDTEQDVKFNILYSKKTILANKILAKELQNIDVTEDEIFKYYNLNRNLFMQEIASYKIQKFEVKKWAIADSAIKLYNEGEAFYTIAKNLGRNYNVKTVEKKDVSSALWQLLQGMKKWYIRIINDDGRLNVVQLLEIKNEKKPIAFQLVKDSLKTKLIEDRKKSFLNNTLERLKIKYKAKIF